MSTLVFVRHHQSLCSAGLQSSFVRTAILPKEDWSTNEGGLEYSFWGTGVRTTGYWREDG
ncbi:MAG: hypothetical protein IJR02_05215 [Bacteroidaceae bacterium]|nr:hypothetical protein [Bacteroidaceae bacterium]